MITSHLGAWPRLGSSPVPYVPLGKKAMYSDLVGHSAVLTLWLSMVAIAIEVRRVHLTGVKTSFSPWVQSCVFASFLSWFARGVSRDDLTMVLAFGPALYVLVLSLLQFRLSKLRLLEVLCAFAGLSFLLLFLHILASWEPFQTYVWIFGGVGMTLSWLVSLSLLDQITRVRRIGPGGIGWFSLQWILLAHFTIWTIYGVLQDDWYVVVSYAVGLILRTCVLITGLVHRSLRKV